MSDSESNTSSATTTKTSAQASMALIRDSLDETTLCEKLEARIITTTHSIYTLTDPPNVLISYKSDGTPIAQVVVFTTKGTLVLMEAAGLPPAATGIKGRSIAMENLLRSLEAMWGSACRTPRNTRVGGLYYVIKSMNLDMLKGLEKV